METIEVDGLRIAYERAGDGPPLLLLHGYVGDGPTTWRRQIEGFSDDFTVLARDAPGAGGSSDPPESFGLAGYADCLARLVERLGLRKPHVAGLSFGASMLAFHPSGFRAMARASAENVRDALPHIRVPTLLVYRDKDARAP